MAPTPPPVPSPLRAPLAVALLLLLIAPAIPLAVAQDQDGDGIPDDIDPDDNTNPNGTIDSNPAEAAGDFWVVQGEAMLFQGTSVPTRFITNSSGTVNITIPLHNGRANPNSFVVRPNNNPTSDKFGQNEGTGQLKIWIWLSDVEAPSRGICYEIRNINFSDPSSTDRIDHAYWPDLVTRDLGHRGWNVSYSVNVKPPANGLPAGVRPFPSDVRCPDIGTSEPADGNDNTLVEANQNNNFGRLYFVKEQFLDLTVANKEDAVYGQVPDVIWCAPSATLASDCDRSLRNGDWNKTVTQVSRNTWFIVNTENHGTWQDLRDYNCERSPFSAVGGATSPTPMKPGCTATFPYDLNITLRGALTPVDNTTNLAAASGPTGASGMWNISDRAGLYTARIEIDPRGHLNQGADSRADVVTTSYAFVSEGGELKAKPIEVRWRDFTARFNASEFNTSAANPYPYIESFRISGDFWVENLGKVGTEDRRAYFRYYLDNRTQSAFNSDFIGDGDHEITNTGCSEAALPACTSERFRIDWEASSVLSNARYLPPGYHTLIIEVDTGRDETGTADDVAPFLEIDETNNRIELPIYVRDHTKPVFSGAPKITIDRRSGILAPPATTLRPGENFTIHANVTDDDFFNLEVVANFSYNASVWKTYNLTPIRGFDADRYLLSGITNLTFATNASEENWTVSIVARDRFGNAQNSSTATVKLVRWPLHTIEPAQIFVEAFSDPTEMTLTDSRITTNGINFTIRVLNETTGQFAPDQPNVTSNLALRYTTPKNVTKTLEGDGAWINNTECRVVPVSPSGPGDLVNEPGTTTICNQPTGQELYSTFETIGIEVHDDEGGPGLWNFTVIIKDVSGQAREFNRSVRILDAAPVIQDKTLFPSTVLPGDSFNVSVNATDDVEVKAAYVNFTRSAPADGTYVNLTLFNASTHTETINGQTRLLYWWNSTFETGRGKVFGVGGTFGVNLSVKDGTDNWRTESLGTFVVDDKEAPQVDSVVLTPPVQEVGQNVSFALRARDATNVTAWLRVLQGSLVVFPANATADTLGVKMTEETLGNFSYSLNISREGEYTYIVDVIDSVGRKAVCASCSGPITFRDNLGPRFEMRSPSFSFDGQRYAGPLPRLEALVYDSEGVVASSLTMKVDNVTVSPELLPAPAGANGYLVVYSVPAAKRYHHRDVVTVNFTALDNSTRQLGGFGNFTFVVDDVPPIVRLASVEPSYRARPTDPLNISLATRFTLTADDNDGLPTEADTITLQILGGGNNGEIVYTGPFKINDAPGLYTGPRVYSVQYWATDSVGNRNATKNITTVFVDESPPTLFQYLPQGRFINATFVDDRVGVARAVVWHRINNEPFTPISLVQDGDQWTTTLAEGKKGDHVAYYLQAWDRLNNTATYGNASAPYASFDVGNHEPQLKITQPIDGSRVSRQVDLRWNASDEDRDALVFTVSYKAPGSTTYRELTKLENTEARRYTIDTSKYPDGEYTFRVAVSDGGFSRVSEVTLTIINQASPVGPVTVPSEAQPGESVLIKAQITKAQAVVEARVYLEGDLVQAYAMNDEGRDGDEVANDGYYSIKVPVDAAGDYRVEIFTRYIEDGVEKQSTVAEAATFSAKLTPGYVLSEYAFLIAGIGLLAAVGIGVAVFVIVRRK